MQESTEALQWSFLATSVIIGRSMGSLPASTCLAQFAWLCSDWPKDSDLQGDFSEASYSFMFIIWYHLSTCQLRYEEWWGLNLSKLNWMNNPPKSFKWIKTQDLGWLRTSPLRSRTIGIYWLCTHKELPDKYVYTYYGFDPKLPTRLPHGTCAAWMLAAVNTLHWRSASLRSSKQGGKTFCRYLRIAAKQQFGNNLTFTTFTKQPWTVKHCNDIRHPNGLDCRELCNLNLWRNDATGN